MDDVVSSEVSVPDNILQPLLIASSSSTLDKALARLIEIARTTDGRSDLASKSILPTVLQLCQSISYPSCRSLLLSALKLLRNLCAGELSNQNSFIEQNGVGVVSSIFNSAKLDSNSDFEMVRIGLQVLGNVSLAGDEHQHEVWSNLFTLGFVELARVQSKGTSDPLCMIIYTFCEGSDELIADLCSDKGLPIVAEIIRTVSAVGFGEDWFKLLLSRICLDESYYSPLFSKLFPSGDSDDTVFKVEVFYPEQAFLLRILSEILNERVSDITVSSDFAVWLLGIFRKSAGIVDFLSRGGSGLPTGLTCIDVLGYSLTILRDICASDDLGGFKDSDSVDVVDSLLSLGLLELMLDLLQDIEPPAIIRKAAKQDEFGEGESSFLGKLCPYKGFRRDLVAVVGNCAYRRKHVQDWIRQKNKIMILLQQCVTDEDNPFLREWGIWSVRNLLEGNEENQRLVSELELQGSVDMPEISGLGLRVEVDPKTQRAKLVNIS